MNNKFLIKSLSLACLLAASTHAAAVTVKCEWIQQGQSICEANADGYSNPQPYDFQWYIFGEGPFTGFSWGTTSFQSVYCGSGWMPDSSVTVVVRDANNAVVGASSTQADCHNPQWPPF